jgi:hypothetical protein
MEEHLGPCITERESNRVIRGLRKFDPRRLGKTKDFLWSAEAELEFRRIIISLLKRVVLLRHTGSNTKREFSPYVRERERDRAFLGWTRYRVSVNVEIEPTPVDTQRDGNHKQTSCTRSEA